MIKIKEIKVKIKWITEDVGQCGDEAGHFDIETSRKLFLKELNDWFSKDNFTILSINFGKVLNRLLENPSYYFAEILYQSP